MPWLVPSMAEQGFAKSLLHVTVLSKQIQGHCAAFDFLANTNSTQIVLSAIIYNDGCVHLLAFLAN